MPIYETFNIALQEHGANVYPAVFTIGHRTFDGFSWQSWCRSYPHLHIHTPRLVTTGSRLVEDMRSGEPTR